MNGAKTVTLGISMGPQQVGVAVAIKGELVDWATLSFKERWSEQKPKRVWHRIQAIIKTRKVTRVILLASTPIHSKTVAFVDEQLATMAGAGTIAYERRSLGQLKNSFAEPSKNKRQLYEKIQEHIGSSELDPAFTKPMLNQYHGKVTEAIALLRFN